MQIRFPFEVGDNADFAKTYQSEFEKKVMPRWFRILSGFVLLFGIGAIGYEMFADPVKLVVLYLLLAGFIWIWYIAHSRCYQGFYARYFRESKGAGLCVVEVADGQFTMENYSVRTSYPLASLSKAYERDNFVYLYFGRLGAGRIPFSAFESEDQRGAFMSLVSSQKEMPNHLTEPASPSLGGSS
jgi:YcxB-like protein